MFLISFSPIPVSSLGDLGEFGGGNVHASADGVGSKGVKVHERVPDFVELVPGVAVQGVYMREPRPDHPLCNLRPILKSATHKSHQKSHLTHTGDEPSRDGEVSGEEHTHEHHY